MGLVSSQNPWAFALGLVGNIISFMVFLAPLPTFIRIWKKRTTEGFKSLPYLAALFSATLWIFYAFQKEGETLIITINAVGCVIETIYVAIYIAFAPRKARTFTLRFLLLLNLGGVCAILLICHFLADRDTRVKALGWICIGFNICVFAAPLSVMKVVIRTRSVEFMPFSLSFFLTVSAVTWLLYGLSMKDFYVAFPNVLGSILGAIQMILYVVYKYFKAPTTMKEAVVGKDKTASDHVIDMAKLDVAVVPAPDEVTREVVSPPSEAGEDVDGGSREAAEKEQPAAN